MQLCMQCKKTQTDPFHNPEDSMRPVDPIRFCQTESIEERTATLLGQSFRRRLTEFYQFENIRPELHAKHFNRRLHLPNINPFQHLRDNNFLKCNFSVFFQKKIINHSIFNRISGHCCVTPHINIVTPLVCICWCPTSDTTRRISDWLWSNIRRQHIYLMNANFLYHLRTNKYARL